MGIYEQIAAAAAQRPGYTPPPSQRVFSKTPSRFTPTTNARPRPGGRAPGVGGTTRRDPARDVQEILRKAAEGRAVLATQTPQGPGSPLNAIGRAAGKGFMGVLTAADLARRAYQGVAGEIGDLVESIPGNTPLEFAANTVAMNPFQLRSLEDENGNRDQSFNPTEIIKGITSPDAFDHGFADRSPWMDDLPNILRAPTGFAGDILTDPLTYLTAGTAGAVKSGALGAARVTLAQNVAEAVARDAAAGVARKVAPEVGEELIRQAGKRGLGALTERGLARAGASIDDVVSLGLDPKFAYSTGVGKARMTIPGTRRLAEGSENLKGAIKSATGASRPGRLSRELFKSYQYGERQIKQEILSGGADAATAARALVMLGKAKGDSHAWLAQTVHELRNLKDQSGRTLPKLSDSEAKALTHALEAEDFAHPLVKEVSEFFEKVGISLSDKGVAFNTRRHYVPHRLSEHAQKMLNQGDPEVRAQLDEALDRPELFQKVRQSDESIADINAKWRLNHDYDLLEDDMHVLMAQYLGEGQEAVMKAGFTGEEAVSLGLIKDPTKVVSDTKVQKAIDAKVAEEGENIAKSVKHRRAALTKAVAVARRDSGEAGRRVATAEKAVADANRKVVRLQDRAATTERSLRTLETAASQTADLAKKARGQEKVRLTKQLDRIEARRVEMEVNYNTAKKALDESNVRTAELVEDVATAEAEFDQFESNLRALRAERKEMEDHPIAKDAVKAQEKADRDAAKAQVAADKFATAQGEVETAVTTQQWLKADLKQLDDRVTADLAEFDDFMRRMDAKEMKGRTKAGSVEQKAQRQLQRDRMTEIQKIIRGSNDPQVQDIAAIEAQAIMADAAAMRAGMDATRLDREFKAGVDLLNNPRFQDYIVTQSEAGFELMERHLASDVMINQWYKDAVSRGREFVDPATRGHAFRQLNKVMKKYMGAMNWWKGWAVTSPGFVFRNLYGGVFAFYLDDVNPVVASRFSRYLYQVQHNGQEAATAWATRKYRAEGAERLSEAYRVAAASGWGLNQAEVATSLTGKRLSWNPLSSNNPLTYAARHGSGEVEAFLRGGHALAVLERGGTFADALQRVEKFHFNYRDISDFDKAAKAAMPFWTFWSRNMALQAQVFAQKPQKINRSFMNAKRNIEDVSDDPGVPVPWYLTNDMAGIRTPFGGAGKGQMYVTPDVPSFRYPGAMAQMADDPFQELLSNMGPGIKLPAQLIQNKDSFTGNEYKNSLVSYDENGEVPRLAPALGQLPGVRNVLDVLPGTELVDDTLLMQDNVQAALEGINPVVSRVNRALPNTQRNEETFRQYWLGWLGAPVRWNDPGSQRGAEAAAKRQATNNAERVQERIRLERLVRG